MTGMIDNDGVPYLKKIAEALTRQADVMERDVPLQSEEIQSPEDITLAERVEKQWQENVRAFGLALEVVLTRAYLNDFERAKAIRSVCEQMKNFEIPVEE
jgi:hypothetical protein